MESPVDATTDDVAGEQSTVTHDSNFDASSYGAAPVFVPSDDGSMIYRSIRVREAKVCETEQNASASAAELSLKVSFPLSGTSPNSSGRRSGYPAETSDTVDETRQQAMPYVFCEMQELMYNGYRQNFEWRQTTRWMFFEEIVESPGDRWSKPHVPSLPAASVFDFRNCLIAGTIVLNLDASSFEEMIDMIGDILIATNQLSAGAKPEFLSILHLPHLHHFEYRKSALRSLEHMGQSARYNMAKQQQNNDSKIDGKDESRGEQQTSGNPDRVHKVNPAYRRYVPANAQGACILVGEVAALRSQLTVFVRLARPLCIGDLTEVDTPLRFLCILLGPPPGKNNTSASMTLSENYSLPTMGRVFGALLSNPAFSRIAMQAENREGLMAAFDSVVDRSTLLPAETWDPDVRLAPIAFPSVSKHSSAQAAANRQTMRILPTAEADLDSSLTRTGALFGGLCRDIRRKLPYYVVDFSNCAHAECGVAAVVMLLTTLTWLLVFSAMYESMTNYQIGASETLLGASIAGIVFYLTAGQPLTIIGTTASLFAFERAIFAFCQMYLLDYVGFHFWVIFWTLVVLFVVVMFDLSAIVCYFTRFTQEVFSVFIASVLMVEAIASLTRIQREYPLTNELCVCSRDPELFTDEATCRVRSIATCHHLVGCQVAGNCAKPNSFIFSCLLFVLTYLLIAKFKSFRASFMFPNRIRVLVGNCALPLAIIILTVFASLVAIDVPRLHFSPLNSDGSFATTDRTRSAFVDPGVVPAWAVFSAALVALPCALLIVMDQHFAAIVVNRRENRLKHGSGYHLDLVALGAGLLISALFGLPMFAGVVILSYANIVSLQKTDSSKKESRLGYSPLSFQICEQRVTNLIVSVLLGFCILLRGVFSYIPVAVLYGVFFYIGLAMLTGTQFWHRFKLIWVPIKYQPDYKFLRYIELIKVHVFTAFQITLFLTLWLVTVIKPISFIFPLLLFLIALIRRTLTYGYSSEELHRLDAIVIPLRSIFCPSEGGLDETVDQAPPPGKQVGELVNDARARLAKGLNTARKVIRKRMSPRERYDEEAGGGQTSTDLEATGDDEERPSYYRDESSRYESSPEKPTRHSTLKRSERCEESSDEATASTAPGGVYASATAKVMKSPTSSSKKTTREPEPEATPPASSATARLLTRGTVTTVGVDGDTTCDGEETVISAN